MRSLSQERCGRLPAGSLRGVSHPHPRIKSGAGSTTLPLSERDAYTEVQEETSCRGFGGVPRSTNHPPRMGDQGGLKTDFPNSH